MVVQNLSTCPLVHYPGTPGTNLSLVTIVDIINYLVNDSAYPDILFLRQESDFIPGFRSNRNGCLHSLDLRIDRLSSTTES